MQTINIQGPWRTLCISQNRSILHEGRGQDANTEQYFK